MDDREIQDLGKKYTYESLLGDARKKGFLLQRDIDIAMISRLCRKIRSMICSAI